MAEPKKHTTPEPVHTPPAVITTHPDTFEDNETPASFSPIQQIFDSLEDVADGGPLTRSREVVSELMAGSKRAEGEALLLQLRRLKMASEQLFNHAQETFWSNFK